MTVGFQQRRQRRPDQGLRDEGQVAHDQVEGWRSALTGSGKQRLRRQFARVELLDADRASTRSRSLSWAWPTSTPTTLAAPCRSRRSVKPPVLWPTSRQRACDRLPGARRAPFELEPATRGRKGATRPHRASSAVAGLVAVLGHGLPGTGAEAPAQAGRDPGAAPASEAARPRSTSSGSARISSGRCRGFVGALLGTRRCRWLLVAQLGQHGADLLQVQGATFSSRCLGST